MRNLPRSAILTIALLLAPSIASAQASCYTLTTTPPPRVNMDRVRQVWLSWNNRLRNRLHLQPYTLNPYLNLTASNWSTYAVKRGMIDHKRSANADYYDYSAIEAWFGSKGLEFANVNGKTFTENIGWGVYDCSASDCTSQLIDAIRSTFTFFLSEKGASYSPHYNSLVNAQFREIGVGIAVSPQQHRYYLTIHYGTTITSAPMPICTAQ